MRFRTVAAIPKGGENGKSKRNREYRTCNERDPFDHRTGSMLFWGTPTVGNTRPPVVPSFESNLKGDLIRVGRRVVSSPHGFSICKNRFQRPSQLKALSIIPPRKCKFAAAQRCNVCSVHRSKCCGFLNSVWAIHALIYKKPLINSAINAQCKQNIGSTTAINHFIVANANRTM